MNKLSDLELIEDQTARFRRTIRNIRKFESETVEQNINKDLHSNFNDASAVELEVNTTIENIINEEKNIDSSVNPPIEDQVN